jgi:hypothetical protein
MIVTSIIFQCRSTLRHLRVSKTLLYNHRTNQTMTCSRLEPAIAQSAQPKTFFHLKKISSILCADPHTNINPLKREVHPCNTVFKNSVPTSRKTYYVFIAEDNWLMQFREITTVCQLYDIHNPEHPLWTKCKAHSTCR